MLLLDAFLRILLQFAGTHRQYGRPLRNTLRYGARIPVWILVNARQQSLNDADLLQAYPSLDAEQLSQAWAYARAHPADIDAAIVANGNA